MRMRQAVFDWLEGKLVFDQRIVGAPLTDHVSPHPCLVQLVDYLRQGRKIHSDDDDDSDPDTSSKLFEKKAAFFLEMFNSTDLHGNPCHVCSHSTLPSDHRHCLDRRQAVSKCAEALVSLFLSAMPSIPSPNKWTTLFGPLSFTLSGILVHGWLPEVFHRAFQDLPFAEFNTAAETTDPRLVETLWFHAVTCPRFIGKLAE